MTLTLINNITKTMFKNTFKTLKLKNTNSLI